MTKSLARSFLAIALTWLLLGMVQGTWMGATNALQYRDVHVAMLMPGFVVLSVYGFIYRLWPSMEAAPFARLQFWLAVVASATMVAGAAVMVLTGSVVLIAVGSVLSIIGAALLVFIFFRNSDR